MFWDSFTSLSLLIAPPIFPKQKCLNTDGLLHTCEIKPLAFLKIFSFLFTSALYSSVTVARTESCWTHLCADGKGIYCAVSVDQRTHMMWQRGTEYETMTSVSLSKDILYRKCFFQVFEASKQNKKWLDKWLTSMKRKHAPVFEDWCWSQMYWTV